MHLIRPSVVLFLVAFVLLAGLLAGCGGGGDQAQDGAQDEATGGAKQGDGNGQGQGAAGQEKEPSARKIMLGTVVFVNPETERFTLRPSTEAQGEEPIPFKVVPKAEITLDDKEATFEDIQQGQQAQVEYVVKNDQNRARVVTLFSEGESDG